MDLESKLMNMHYDIFESGSEDREYYVYDECIFLVKELKKKHDLPEVEIVNVNDAFDYFKDSEFPILKYDEVMIFKNLHSGDIGDEFCNLVQVLYKHNLCKKVEYF